MELEKTQEEIDETASQALFRGDDKKLNITGYKIVKPAKIDLAAFQARQITNRQKQLISDAKAERLRKEAEPNFDVSPTDLPSLKRELLRKYGNFTRAWKCFLDKDGSGSVTFMEFSTVLRDMAFKGNIKAVFEELDVEKNKFIRFAHFAPQESELVDGFKAAMVAKSGNVARCW